mgnify:CR=1 FL=1
MAALTTKELQDCIEDGISLMTRSQTDYELSIDDIRDVIGEFLEELGECLPVSDERTFVLSLSAALNSDFIN